MQTDLNNLLEAWLSAPDENRRAAFSTFVKALKAGADSEAIPALRRAAVPDLDFTAAQSLCRVLKRVKHNAELPGRPMKLAVLGGFTTKQIAPMIELFLVAGGVSVEIFEADFGTFRMEILDPTSDLHGFRPDVVWLAASRRDVARIPAPGDDADAAATLVAAEVEEWSALWQTLAARLDCTIVQNNFDPPPQRSMGNLEAGHAAGTARFFAQLNAALADAAPAHVTIHDVDHLAACAGRWAWGDDRFYFHAKMPCAPDFMVDYAHSVAALLLAVAGRAKKCLVLDLDNTLWGGVIGDDGLGGIRLGQGEASAEAFLAFQRYAKALKERGVILAVCSKNEDANAREPFEKHPEMVLKLDDISCFVANWTDKATNLRAIARQLNIGLDALVFVDDNPAERALVRQLAPEVAVPQMPDDPAGYIRALDRHRYFETTSLGSADLQRTEFYRANAERAEASTTSGSVEDFLRALDMTARIGPVDATSLERTVQLIGRSNQFNLTTRRHSAADVQRMMDAEDWLTLTVSLTDRFGDNGLISVLLGRVDAGTLIIDTWLMSCRVLKRGVEYFVLNHLAARGFTALRGEYIPTAKNALVRDHYAGLGFTQISKDPDWWELLVEEDRQPMETYITEKP